MHILIYFYKTSLSNQCNQRLIFFVVKKIRVNLGNLRLISLCLSRQLVRRSPDVLYRDEVGSFGEGGCFLCLFVTKYISEIREICG